MNPRRHIFFDLDHTLWDFERNALECISELIDEYKHHFDNECDPDSFFNIYSKINRELWDAYERKEIEMEAVRKGRWERAFSAVNIGPGKWMQEFGNAYVERCPTKPHLMDGTHELLSALSVEFDLGIISNGLSSNQFTKLNNAGIDRFFKDVVTVDMVGHPKPDKRMFDFALQRCNAEARHSMYIGDTYESDVRGSLQAGLSAIYFNPHDQPNPLGVTEVKHLGEIPHVLDAAWRS